MLEIICVEDSCWRLSALRLSGGGDSCVVLRVRLEMPVLSVMPWCRCCSKMCLHALENALIWRCGGECVDLEMWWPIDCVLIYDGITCWRLRWSIYRLLSIPRFFVLKTEHEAAWRIVKLTEYCAWRDYCLQIAACLKARLYMKYRWTLFFADRYKAGIYCFVIFITKWIWFCYYNKIVCWMIMKSCWFRAL